jgi:hypothetical protein
MKIPGVSNALGGEEALRGTERGMDPGFAQRQLRVPGPHMMQPHISTGLRPPQHMGSMHTMPHLRRFSGTPHFGVGGLSNPVGELLGPSTSASGANDAQYRQFLQMIGQPMLTNKALQQTPSAAASFGYQQGGQAGEDEGSPEDVESPDEDMSPDDQQEKQTVLNAMAALEGQSPNPEQDLAAFIDAFGPRALADLQQLVESKHSEEQGGDQGDEDDQSQGQPQGDPGDEGSSQPQGEPGDDEDQDQEAATALQGGQAAQGAGGGLLHGRGTGQSDEIEATTPHGHPVLLSDGEYVIDAPTVAALGDGSTKAGARRLDDLRKQIRSKSYGHDKQAKPMSRGGRPGTEVVLRLK